MKFFIDCGTHYFQGLKDFSKKYNFDNTWTVFSFEANPNTFKLSKSKIPTNISYKLLHENKAVWKNNDGININCEGNKEDGCSSTVLNTPPEYDKTWGSNHLWKSKVFVESIRLSDLIKSIKKDSEKIVIKIDIEGAEFEVLQDMIETNSLEMVDDLYVEFHERFFMEKEQEYFKIKENLLKIINLKCNTFEVWK